MRTTKQRHVFKYWVLEALSVILAIGLIAAIISILAQFNKKTVPEWPLGINLNTLIALLATLSRALILLTVAEIISQAKWSWVSRQPRPMNVLQRFDSASRGLLGSTSLLFTAPGSILSLAGSLVVIVSLAMGPFAQQAIKSIDCMQYVSDANASVPIAHYTAWKDKTYRMAVADWLVTVDMQGALVTALVNPGGNDSSVAATCQTGNCTFHPDSTNISYSTIGLCSLSIDTTELVSRVSIGNHTTDHPQFNYTLPNGLNLRTWPRDVLQNKFMDDGPNNWNLTWASPAFSEDFRNLAPLSLYNFTILEFTKASCDNFTYCGHNVAATRENLGAWDYISVTSILYPCMKNYHAGVEKGTFQENLISTVPARENWLENNESQPFTVNYNYTALKTPCVINGREYGIQNTFSDVPRFPGRRFTTIAVDDVHYSAPEECLYKMHAVYYRALWSFLNQTLLAGNCQYHQNTMDVQDVYCPFSWWLEPFYHGGNATFNTISNTIENVATGATNKLRTIGSSNFDPYHHEVALGTVSQTTVCMVFDWKWLLLPIILVVITAVLLALIVIQNYREPQQPGLEVLPAPIYVLRYTRRVVIRGRGQAGVGPDRARQAGGKCARQVVWWG
jgi:hypothetical protein